MIAVAEVVDVWVAGMVMVVTTSPWGLARERMASPWVAAPVVSSIDAERSPPMDSANRVVVLPAGPVKSVQAGLSPLSVYRRVVVVVPAASVVVWVERRASASRVNVVDVPPCATVRGRSSS